MIRLPIFAMAGKEMMNVWIEFFKALFLLNSVAILAILNERMTVV